MLNLFEHFDNTKLHRVSMKIVNVSVHIPSQTNPTNHTLINDGIQHVIKINQIMQTQVKKKKR